MNLLNTSYNKATYTGVAAAGFVLLAALSVQFGWNIRPETWAAMQGFVTALVTLMVPNKEV